MKASAPRSRERRFAWQAANKDRLNAKARERYARNKKNMRAAARAEYARRKARHGEAWGDEVHRSLLRSKFNITRERYVEILVAQGGKCACCGARESPGGRRLAVDHDHATGKIRGLLCTRCNAGIGHLGDSVEGVRRALVYLETRSA